MYEGPIGGGVLTFGDYLDDFTDFLASFAGWGVVVIIAVSLIVMLARSPILRVKVTLLQRVTIELFIGLNLLILRIIVANRYFHRPDLPQPYRIVFWLLCLVLFWRFFYFALWSTWLRPVAIGAWLYLMRPRIAAIPGYVRHRTMEAVLWVVVLVMIVLFVLLATGKLTP